MKIPSLTKTRRESIGKRQLAEALPTDAWFDTSKVPLDISTVSLRSRLKGWPYVKIKMPNPQKMFFFVAKEDHGHLLKWAERNGETNVCCLKQKIKPYNLSLSDICHNLFEGVRVSSEQMEVIN